MLLYQFVYIFHPPPHNNTIHLWYVLCRLLYVPHGWLLYTTYSHTPMASLLIVTESNPSNTTPLMVESIRSPPLPSVRRTVLNNFTYSHIVKHLMHQPLPLNSPPSQTPLKSFIVMLLPIVIVVKLPSNLRRPIYQYSLHQLHIAIILDLVPLSPSTPTVSNQNVTDCNILSQHETRG